jgi:hypothetical protein
MIARIKINDTPIKQVERRLNQLGLQPHQVQKHIDALTRPKPKPRYVLVDGDVVRTLDGAGVTARSKVERGKRW